MINKGTTDRFIKERVPYEMVSREVVQSIECPVALAVYVYLLTMPDNWVPRRDQVIEHFNGLGRDRYASAMKELRDKGLVWIAETRNERGHVVDRVMVVEALPRGVADCKPKVGKPTSGNIPTLGKSGPLKIQTSIKDTDIGAKRKRFTAPTLDEVAEYCKERGNNVDPNRFIDHYEANGWMRGKTKIKCWKACVRTWEKNEAKNTFEGIL